MTQKKILEISKKIRNPLDKPSLNVINWGCHRALFGRLAQKWCKTKKSLKKSKNGTKMVQN